MWREAEKFLLKDKYIGPLVKKWDKAKSAKFAEKKWKPWRTVASWYLWQSLESR
jgi:3-methyladenine DNA glycosylase/8-oxoguanine DNA glycosylase